MEFLNNMKKKSSNKNLKAANKAKKDEFYTQLTDIEQELKHYKEQFRGKVVFCNCDDPNLTSQCNLPMMPGIIFLINPWMENVRKRW